MHIDDVEDKVVAAAFRRLVKHMQHRTDAQNIDLMGLAGFCRNCLADWTMEASEGTLSRAVARQAIYGMPYEDWKALQPPATSEQLAKMEESVSLNRV